MNNDNYYDINITSITITATVPGFLGVYVRVRFLRAHGLDQLHRSIREG